MKLLLLVVAALVAGCGPSGSVGQPVAVRERSGLAQRAGLPSGLRISATYGVVAAVIAEYPGATARLGIWMQLSQR